MIGTLLVELASIASLEDYGLKGNKDECVEVHIERIDTEGGEKGDPKARNPQIAKSSLFSELRTLARQLKAMGYKTIFSCPSDPRRYRVYRRIGMKPIGDEGELYADVDELINR